MKYCTNCGVKSKKKFCDACDAKRNTSHNFCGWCGEAIPEGAHRCKNCKEPIKESAGAKVGRVLFAVIEFLLFAFCLLNAVLWAHDLPYTIQYAGSSVVRAVIILVLFLLSALVVFPLVRGWVRSATPGKKGRRALINALRVILAVALLWGGVYMGFVTNDMETDVNQWGHSIKAEALETFHERYALKNEDSFVLNDWRYKEVLSDTGDVYYIVTLDWSAENSLGGMTRQETVITLCYDEETGELYALDD